MNRLYILLIICMLLPMALHAQDMALDTVSNTYQLDDAVVTSFREGGEVVKIPATVTVLSSKRIEKNRVETLRGLTSVVPNLYMPNYGSQLTAPIFIRGIGSRINAPSVGLYVDYIPYFDKASFDFELFDIAGIEVLSGPQGTLYGRNTMGGIINVSSLSPLHYQKTHVLLSGGNYGFANATLSHYNKIGDKTGFSVGANYLHNGGYFTNTYDDSKVGVLDAVSAKVRLVHQFSANFRAELFAQYEHSKQDGYPYAIIDKNNPDNTKINYNEPSYYDRDLLSAGALLEWTTNDFVLRAVTSYQYLDDKQGVDQDYSPLSICFATQTQHQNMLSEEIIMKSNTNGNYQWLVGVSGFWQQADKEIFLDYKQDAVAMKMVPALMKQDMIYDQPTYGWAAFHQSTWNNLLLNGLSLSAGIRVDNEYSKSDETQIVTIVPTSKVTTTESSTSLDFIQALPKVTLSYALASRNTVYASVAKGYKTGGFNVAVEDVSDKTFAPEYSWNYEVGAKINLFDSRLQAQASVFYIDWRDQQVYQFNPSGRGALLRNAGHTANKGFELALAAHPIKNLAINATYGYTHASYLDYKQEVKKVVGANTVTMVYDSTGNYIPYVPQNTLSVAADYTININKKLVDNVVLGVQYLGTGKIYWEDTNTHSQPYYGVLNARVSAIKSFVELAVWAQNITDTKYQTFYFEALGNSYLQYGKPFLVGVDLRFKF